MIETTRVIYDEESRNWSSDPEINKLFLENVRRHLFDRLRARGHLFLNEVHDELGLPRTSRGQLIGWLMQDSITLWEEERREGQDLIWITFLTHGEIYDKI